MIRKIGVEFITKFAYLSEYLNVSPFYQGVYVYNVLIPFDRKPSKKRRIHSPIKRTLSYSSDVQSLNNLKSNLILCRFIYLLHI